MLAKQLGCPSKLGEAVREVTDEWLDERQRTVDEQAGIERGPRVDATLLVEPTVSQGVHPSGETAVPARGIRGCRVA